MTDLAGKDVVKDKDDVLAVVNAALAELGRQDDVIFSYAVVEDDIATRRRLLYFDLPRISPLQFNLTLERDLSRKVIISRIKEAINTRLKQSKSDQTFDFY